MRAGRWLTRLALQTFGVEENLEPGPEPVEEPDLEQLRALSTRSTQVPVEEPDLEQFTRSTHVPVEESYLEQLSSEL